MTQATAKVGRFWLGAPSGADPKLDLPQAPQVLGVPVSTLFYGDNLDVLRKYIRDETIDLCYIDPPFNSNKNYNRIYNRIGKEDAAQAQAFVDTWTWNDLAEAGYAEIQNNAEGRFSPQTVDLIKGLQVVLKKGSLLAYLISMTLRVTEIRRVLKPTGSFYLHCDQTASHYLKLVLDSVFVARGGDFLNEIAWCYKSGGASKRHFSRKHDVIFLYAKSAERYKFNYQQEKSYNRGLKPYHFKGVEEFKDEVGWYTMVGMKDYWNIDMVGRTSSERLGYPTQKPEKLLERIIEASSDKGDVVLDAYCGCGTTIAVAQRLGREWIGIDITYQAISLILSRLEGNAGKLAWPEIEKSITLNGIPRDIDSAKALALKKDDRVRKEFEKWAVLTYTNNRAIINERRGADGGIDGIAYFMATRDDSAKVVLQVKSGHVTRADIAQLRGDMMREGATLAVFITLEEPTAPMRAEASAAGSYAHALMGRSYDVIQIVTVQEILDKRRFDVPMSTTLDASKRSKTATSKSKQTPLDSGEGEK
jgi:site-specific DNA-methyltransferase (adenine-specific)